MSRWALEEADLSPRELAVRFTDEKRYFVSELTVYRLLTAHDLITSPAYVVIKAADQFHTKTTRPNEMWQTDLTYFKIIGWSWMYLSTVLDDFSRYIIAWKLCTNIPAAGLVNADVRNRRSRSEIAGCRMQRHRDYEDAGVSRFRSIIALE